MKSSLHADPCAAIWSKNSTQAYNKAVMPLQEPHQDLCIESGHLLGTIGKNEL